LGKRGVKYNHDGYVFDSKLEINHYETLKKHSDIIEIIRYAKNIPTVGISYLLL
jgi:uncharacterized protein with von Willebrand factor type A (vWA) domain